MGSLLKYQPSATDFQRKAVTVQVLSALEYLHELEIPIVHRDIKPENILVKEWGPHRVHIKLGDFGLSKEGKLLETFCGNLLYLAPEGYTMQTETMYTTKVDVWSVGVLDIWLETGNTFPKYLRYYRTDGMAWATVMVEFARAQLRRCRSESSRALLTFAIDYMLVIHPADRGTARECRVMAEQLATEEPASSPGSEYSDVLYDDNSDGSQPATPKALPVDGSNFTQDLDAASEASTIRAGLFASLGQRGSSAFDSILGLAPSNMAKFEALGSGAVTPVAMPGNDLSVSVLNKGLWNGSTVDCGFIQSVESDDDDEEEEEISQPEQDQGPDSQSFTFLADLHHDTGGDGGAVIFAEMGPSSQIKRQWTEVEDVKGVDAADDHQPATGAGHRKRSKVVHCEQ